MDFQIYRNEFEAIRHGRIHLNHAGVSPLPRRTAQAMKESIARNCDLTPENWHSFIGTLQQCRESIARMLNVPPRDIALTRNTTEGINWIANGIEWNPGDRIVTVEGEYPANIYPWMRLERKGIELKRIQPIENRVPLEIIEAELTSHTRLLTISFVEFSSGFRFDLDALGKLCQERGVLFSVDLIQGMGVFPLDLSSYPVTFASGGAQKWLLGPQGAGFFYCPKSSLDLLEVTSVGATSVTHWLPYTEYDYTLRDDASRFEYGTPPTTLLAGMDSSVRMLLEAGMPYVCERVKLLTDLLIEGATRKGYSCHSPRSSGEWSGIVTFTHDRYSSASVVKHLQGQGMEAAEREGRIRLTPHFYQSEEEMIRVVDSLL